MFILFVLPFGILVVAIWTMLKAMHFEELWALIKEQWNK